MSDCLSRVKAGENGSLPSNARKANLALNTGLRKLVDVTGPCYLACHDGGGSRNSVARNQRNNTMLLQVGRRHIERPDRSEIIHEGAF